MFTGYIAEDLSLFIWKYVIMKFRWDVSSDAGDGTADCAHLGLAPLDVDLQIFWRTTLLFCVDLIVLASRG